MSGEDNLKRQLREKMDSVEFQFSEADWAQAEAYNLQKRTQEVMDSAEYKFHESDWYAAKAYIGRKRFTRKLAYAAVAATVLLLSVIVPMLLTRENSEVAIQQPVNKDDVNSSLTQPSMDVRVPASMNAEPASVSESPAKNVKAVSTSPLSSEKHNSAAPEKSVAKPVVPPEIKAPLASEIKLKTKSQSTAGITSADNVEKTLSVNQETANTETKPVVKNRISMPAAGRGDQALFVREKFDPEGNSDGLQKKGNETNSTKVPFLEGEPGKITVADNSAVKQPEINKEPVANDTKPAMETKQELLSEKEAPVPVQNSVTAENSANDKVAVADFPKPDSLRDKSFGLQNGFFYEAGVSAMLGWKNEASGFNPLIGINFFNVFGDKVGGSFGVQYTRVDNLSVSSKMSKVVSYKFGEESDVTVITPQTLYYLSIPLRLHYFYNAKNTFGIGYRMSYLLNVDAKSETYHEGIGGRTNYKSVALNMRGDGFRWFDQQLSLFYRRTIWKRVEVGAEVVVGITDVKQNAFFGGANAFESNTGLQVTLVYNLFKKINNK
jgi:hypothetical protein